MVIVVLLSMKLLSQGEVDYESLDQEMLVSATHSRQCVNVTIINEDVVEEDEDFSLSISSVFKIAGYSDHHEILIKKTTVTIINDDCK